MWECFIKYKEVYKVNLFFLVFCKINIVFNWFEEFGYVDKLLKYVIIDVLNKMRGKIVIGNKWVVFEGCVVSIVNEYS